MLAGMPETVKETRLGEPVLIGQASTKGPLGEPSNEVGRAIASQY